jgi:hypothetical protein
MLITSKSTANPVFLIALLAQEDIINHLNGIRSHVHLFLGQDSNLSLEPHSDDHVNHDLMHDVYSFEDTMNGLSGELITIDPVLLEQVRAENARIILLAKTAANITCNLHESVLPQATPNTSTETFSITQVGKKVYPLTTTVEIQVPFELSSNVETSEVVESVEVIDVDIADTIDLWLDELDAETATNPPFAYEQANETIPILSAEMIVLSQEAAANSAGLQAGLKTLSKNPLETIIQDARNLFVYYTANNYASLNVTLDGVYSDPALNVQYKTLREAIGGSDGLSGCVAQLDMFRDHTDRLSGLVLSVNSPNAEQTLGNSLTEYIHVNGVPEGNLIQIFSFDAKKFRSAKYTIQASAANTDRGHQVSELYILHDNELAYTREVFSIYTQDPFVSFTTQFLNSNVRVLANVSADNIDFVIHGTKLRVARTSQNYEQMSQQEIIVSHETLQAYLDDGVDYVRLQSGSLLRADVVANLAREFNDMLLILASPAFLAQSTGEKQTEILAWADDIIFRRNEIQTAIDTDYDNFISVRKLVEALEISKNLTVSYTSESANTIPQITLNNATIIAIESEQV